jgi:hypothetical protein
MDSHGIWVILIAPFLISALLLIVAAEYGLYMYFTGWVILLFGFLILPLVLSGEKGNFGRFLLGSGLLALGLSGVLFLAPSLFLGWQDYGVRCSVTGCPPFLQWYGQDFAMLAGSLIAVTTGLWLRLKAHT